MVESGRADVDGKSTVMPWLGSGFEACRPLEYGSLARGPGVTESIATGALEHDVLSRLWLMEKPATPREVLDALDSDLAYTTILTILTHLWRKGLVNRRRRGRAYEYAPALSEAELAAQRMQAALGATSDRKAALIGFARSLSAREARALRELLGASRGRG